MWDSGSTLTFITFDKAASLNLKGVPVKLSIVVVGGQAEVINSQRYEIAVSTQSGQAVRIEAYGIERISSQIDSIDVRHIVKEFGVIDKRPEGEIHMLIGQQYAGFHPVRIKARGHLLLMENQFGKVISGTYPVPQISNSVTSTCLQARRAMVMHTVGTIDKFFEIEGLGVTCFPKCGGCKCGQCQPGGKEMSLKEEKEYKMIEEGLVFDEKRGRWSASYPWIRDPSELPNNRNVAIAILRSTEKRLSRDVEHAKIYNQQIEDMVNRNAARIVSESELAEYSGPKFYISHFEVMNPKSKSTPCRIVYNSSAKFLGHSLNSYLAKGPSMLNRLLGVLLRFRQGKHAFVGDISKMFHAIHIPLREQMTHLFLWRNLKVDQYPCTYAMTAVNMGDRPSSAIAQIALRKSAEQASPEYETAASTIIKNSYMDDIPASTDGPSDSNKLMNEIDAILEPRGFKIKEWIATGSKVESGKMISSGNTECRTDGTEGVLGIKWEPDVDVFRFDAIQIMVDETVTKRNVLSMISKIFDPVGLLTPFTVKLKVFMRKIWAMAPKLGWDERLPTNLKSEWEVLAEEMSSISTIAFKRAITPEDAQSKPVLVVFSDGSENAYGTVAYARWKCNNGKYVSRLISAKSRMAPLKTIDIVRLELCGAVLSKRMRVMIETELSLKFEGVIHIVDSEIVKAMIQRESYGFNTFASNRIGEIHSATEQDEWAWIGGKPWLNIADVTTRGLRPSDLGEDSLWQKGPEFLSLPTEQWPIKKEVRADIDVPELKQKFVGKMKAEPNESLLARFDLKRYSKWKLLVHTLARILHLYQAWRKDTICEAALSVADVKLAEILWIKEAQKELNLKDHKKLRPSYNNDGMIVVGGRTERWMQATWNQQKFILLPKDHEVTMLIMQYEHEKGGHLGVVASIAKVRSKYWVIGISKLMKKMISSSVKCRKKLKLTCKQIMSTLPIERIKPSPPFTNVGVDYFGPFTIKGEVQKRVRGKCFGVIITCLVVRGVYIDIAKDYSTDGFLQVLRRYSSFRGWPSTIFSDEGSQLVRASKELKEVISNLDWNKVHAFGVGNGVTWKFSPADAPWYNGATEALVKSTKRALEAAVGENVMTFSELQTSVCAVAAPRNERPTGILPSAPEDGTYLCPNLMLLGRATTKVPQGPFKERASNKYRIDFIQSIVEAFWKRWTREVFPNLVIEPKWHTERRDLKKGDVVLIQDTNALRGEWKMGLITEPILSEDNRVRRAKVAYRTPSGVKQEVERAVQRLILLACAEESS